MSQGRSSQRQTEGTSAETGEDSPAKAKEEPSGTLDLEKSPSAANRYEAPEVTQDELLTTRVEEPHEN